jgi:proliferating cell nuclear antigen
MTQLLKSDHVKLTLAETRLLKDSVAIIADLVTEVRFRIGVNGVELVAMDPANVAMVIFKLLSSAFAEYKVEHETTLAINLNDLKGVLRRVKPADTLTLTSSENKCVVTLQGTSKREFSLPLIDIDEREQKIPDLKFAATVTTTSDLFTDAIEDADIIGESVALAISESEFTVSSASDLSKAVIDIPHSSATHIKGAAGTRSKYSIEYLKRMTPAGKLAPNVEIAFSRDYPLRLDYKIVDKMDLAFILAPRVEND